MAYDKFMIGFQDNNSGFQTNIKPWAIADNAFETLEDVYVIRGRLKKRFGSIFMGGDQTGSRLRINIGTTDMTTGDLTVAGIDFPGVVYEVGQMFSCSTDIYTVYQTGTPGDCFSTSGATATFNTSTGDFVLTGGPLNEAVYFYPSTPVMGLPEFFIIATSALNNMAFDTQFSYQFDRTNQGWERILAGESVWTGADYQFFWSSQFQNIITHTNTLWTTNFNVSDGIRYWDNAIWNKPVLNYSKGIIVDTTDGSGNASGTLSGTFFVGQVFTIGLTTFVVEESTLISPYDLIPYSDSTKGPTGTGTFNVSTGAYTFSTAQALSSVYFTGDSYIETCQIILEFKNRLLFLNTIELLNGVSYKYPFRVRFSALNNPLSPSSWMDNFPGNGGFIDAPTSEAIITAQFVKDRVIVYCENSTYELVFTNNQSLPFLFQKINSELGAVSTFSEIPFDKVVLGIDDTGIHACNGTNVDRIDAKIPQYPFDISNENNGFERVYGVRDYFNEMAYWTLVPTNRNDLFYFPNTVLVYNYINESWAKINDSFTCFGYFLLPPESSGLTWGQTSTPWGQNTNLWNTSGNNVNNTTIKSILVGNQQGFVRVLRPDITSNAAGLQITNITYYTMPGQATVYCTNHNLSFNQYVLLENVNGITFTSLDGNREFPRVIGRVAQDPVTENTADSFYIEILDNQSLPIVFSGDYTGGGTISLVNNINIVSKQYNFYTEADRNMAMNRVDFLVDRTTNGQVTVDYLVSSTGISLVNEGLGNSASPGPLPGNSTLQTTPYTLSNLERFQARLWHPVYLFAQGECIQLKLYMSADQMFNYSIVDGKYDYTALNDFQLHAMIFYVRATSARMM